MEITYDIPAIRDESICRDERFIHTIRRRQVNNLKYADAQLGYLKSKLEVLDAKAMVSGLEIN